MNLKTSLKAKKITLSSLKLLFLGVCALVFSITACNENEIPIIDESSTNIETLDFTNEERDFFSDEKNDRFASTQNNRLDDRNDSKDKLFFDESLNEVKRFMKNLNRQKENKYITHIARQVGSPVWQASYVIQLNSSDFIILSPIVKDKDVVNGLIVYSKTSDKGESYGLITRAEMASVKEKTDNRNYHFFVQMFYEFDKQLFEGKSEDYMNWAKVDLASEGFEDCYSQYYCPGIPTHPGFLSRVIHNLKLPAFDDSLFDDSKTSSCYVVCSSGCTNDLYNSGIIDTPEEIAWTNNCNGYSSAVDKFLEDNDMSDMAILEASQVLYDIGMANVMTLSEFRGLRNALSAFFENPDNETNVEDLYNFLHSLNIDILGLSTFNLRANVLPDFNVPFFGNWVDMNAGNFFGFTNHLKNGLKADYPSQTLRIDSFFTCRVLGFAQEDAVIASLGVQNNPIPPADPIINYNKRPDGFTQDAVWDDDGIHLQPIFIESKGKYGGWPSSEYNYSTQIAQFDGYRRYLSSPLKTHKPHCSIAHGLYMILPANVSLANNIKTACSNDNIPLFYSGIEYDADYPDLSNIDARVKYPRLQNIDGLDYSCHVFDFLGDTAMKWAVERVLYDWRDYDAVNIAALFQQRTDAFEQSYLVGNDNGCGED